MDSEMEKNLCCNVISECREEIAGVLKTESGVFSVAMDKGLIAQDTYSLPDSLDKARAFLTDTQSKIKIDVIFYEIFLGVLRKFRFCEAVANMIEEKVEAQRIERRASAKSEVAKSSSIESGQEAKSSSIKSGQQAKSSSMSSEISEDAGFHSAEALGDFPFSSTAATPTHNEGYFVPFHTASPVHQSVTTDNIDYDVSDAKPHPLVGLGTDQSLYALSVATRQGPEDYLGEEQNEPLQESSEENRQIMDTELIKSSVQESEAHLESGDSKSTISSSHGDGFDNVYDAIEKARHQSNFTVLKLEQRIREINVEKKKLEEQVEKQKKYIQKKENEICLLKQKHKETIEALKNEQKAEVEKQKHRAEAKLEALILEHAKIVEDKNREHVKEVKKLQREIDDAKMRAEEGEYRKITTQLIDALQQIREAEKAKVKAEKEAQEANAALKLEKTESQLALAKQSLEYEREKIQLSSQPSASRGQGGHITQNITIQVQQLSITNITSNENTSFQVSSNIIDDNFH